MDLLIDFIIISIIVGILFTAVLSAGTGAIKKAIASRHSESR